MRSLMFLTAAGLALAACSKPAPQQAAASSSLAASSSPTVGQLQAQAAAAEAEAARLQAQAGGQAAAPAAAPAAGAPEGAGEVGELAASDQKLHSGQSYDTISFEAKTGDHVHITYLTKAFHPIGIVLGADKKPAHQFEALSPGGDGVWRAESDVKIDQDGRWYVLLSANDVGAAGPYRVNVERQTSLSQ